MEEFLIKIFADMEERIENEIKNIKKSIPKLYEVSNILKLSKEDIEKIFFNNGFSNYKEIAIEFVTYNLMINSGEQVKESFVKHISLLKEHIEKSINLINEIVNNKIKEIDIKINELTNQKEEINYIRETIFHKDILEQEDYEKIYNFIIGLAIPDEEKLLLSQNITLYISEKAKSQVSEEDKEIEEIKKIAENIYREFYSTQDKLGKYSNVREMQELYQREEIREFATNGYDLETFAHALLIEIRDIEKETNLETLKEKVQELHNLVEMYDAYIRLQNDIQDIKTKIDYIYKNGNTFLYKEKLGKIYEFIYNIDITKIRIQNNNDLEEQIRSIKIKLEQAINYENKTIPIKSFIIFPRDDNTHEPYFVNDIIDGKMIDKSTKDFASGEYRAKIPELFYDIIANGTIEYLESTNTSSQNFGNKILSQVFFPDKNKSKKNKINRDLKNRTDMWRIRPTRNSELRYVDKKIILRKGTPIYNQIINLLKENMKKITIDETEDFTLSINYCTGIKKTDGDLYTAAINRRYGENTEGNMINKLLSEEELSDEELAIIDTVIKNSLETYNIIRQKDSQYDFEFIDRMIGGGNKYVK